MQRAELTKERAIREQEAEEAQLASRQAVEKARLVQQLAITQERIKSEEETQRREIARRRALDEAELKTREQTEREQINLELQLETARIARGANSVSSRSAGRRRSRFSNSIAKSLWQRRLLP